MLQYHFIGRLIPERVQLAPIHLEGRTGGPGFAGEFALSLDCSQISFVLNSQAPIPDISTLRNYITDAARFLVCSLGFINGCGYDVELCQVFDPTQAKWILFGVGEPALLKRYGDAQDSMLRRLLAISATPSGTCLRLCLYDLSAAIQRPLDTAFLCYRAIECLRNDISGDAIGELGRANDKASWEQFRSALEIERSSIDFVKQFADARRHGRTKEMSYDDRRLMLETSWAIVDKFLAYREKHPLPGNGIPKAEAT